METTATLLKAPEEAHEEAPATPVLTEKERKLQAFREAAAKMGEADTASPVLSAPVATPDKPADDIKSEAVVEVIPDNPVALPVLLEPVATPDKPADDIKSEAVVEVIPDDPMETSASSVITSVITSMADDNLPEKSGEAEVPLVAATPAEEPAATMTMTASETVQEVQAPIPPVDEKERMLKAMREAAAKRIEEGRVSRARLEQAAAEKPADGVKLEVVEPVMGNMSAPPVFTMKSDSPAEAVSVESAVKQEEVVSPVVTAAPTMLTTTSVVVEEVRTPVPLPKETFVTAAEKERMLKSIRDVAAKEIEDKAALRARLEQFAAEKPVDEKKEEKKMEVLATTAEPAAIESAPPAVMAMGGDKAEVVAVETTLTRPPMEMAAPVPESAPSSQEGAEHLGTLMPPPLRPAAGSLRHKSEIRSATQTRINEAYLRQLKGEEPLPEEEVPESKKPDAPQKPVSSPRRASSRPRPDAEGVRRVPVESFGTGVFNLLGDMVGGVVYLARTVGGGVKKAVAPNPASQASGTAQMADKMAKGVREVFSGAGNIVKGSGNIVIGTLGVVTMPVVEAVGAAIHSIKSPSSPEESEKETTDGSQTSRSDP
ncbi:conserved hypothetical protein [Gammaproteobacteria bacterium]